MKYVSKQRSLTLTLRSGISANRATGTEPVPGIYFRFEGGKADTRTLENMHVDEEQAIAMIEKHRGYNVDFVRADIDPENSDLNIDEMISTGSTEPRHKIQSFKDGASRIENPMQKNVVFTDEQKDVVRDMLKEALGTVNEDKVKKMAEEMAKEMLQEMLLNQKEEFLGKNPEELTINDNKMACKKGSKK
jgi:hypothetical protein